MRVNKVTRVTTINRVAETLGESVEWLHHVALEMEPEDGVIWAYGIDDEGVLASTDDDDGIENLIELIKIQGDSTSSAQR
jgi:hypothetical protein